MAVFYEGGKKREMMPFGKTLELSHGYGRVELFIQNTVWSRKTKHYWLRSGEKPI